MDELDNIKRIAGLVSNKSNPTDPGVMRYNTLLLNVVRGLETEAVESGLSESDARKHVADTLRKLYESYKG